MLLLTSDNFESETSTTFPTVVMFYATWCGKCAMMKPIIENMEKKYQKKIRFFLVDIDRSKELADAYGADIVPTFVFFESGQSTAFMQGIISQVVFEKRLKKIFRIS